MPHQQIVAMQRLPIFREKVSAAWMPGAAIFGYCRRVSNIDMRRNALRLLTPYNSLRYALRGLFATFVEERVLSTTVVIKKVAAIFLFAAFFLPLSQCTVTKPIAETKAIEQETHVTYANIAHEWPSVEALATYTAFLWPLTLGIVSLVWPSLNQKWTIGVFEMLLCVGSGFMLFGLTYLGSLRYGGYIAGGTIGMYFITTSVELVTRIRKTWGKQT